MEGLMRQAGLEPESSRVIKIIHRHADIDESMRAVMSTGPSNKASQILGEPKVEGTIRAVLEQFRGEDGSCSMTNWFRVLTAKRSYSFSRCRR